MLIYDRALSSSSKIFLKLQYPNCPTLAPAILLAIFAAISIEVVGLLTKTAMRDAVNVSPAPKVSTTCSGWKAEHWKKVPVVPSNPADPLSPQVQMRLAPKKFIKVIKGG